MNIRANICSLLAAGLLSAIPYTALAGIGDVLGDIQYQREGGDPQQLADYPPSIFQHWVHRMRFRCDACHNSLFKMEVGGTLITHELMKKPETQACRTCHNGKIAFDAGFENCHRCHVKEEN